MRIFRSIKGRLEGVKNDLKSKYWEYIDYSDDGIIWSETVLFEAFGEKTFKVMCFTFIESYFG